MYWECVYSLMLFMHVQSFKQELSTTYWWFSVTCEQILSLFENLLVYILRNGMASHELLWYRRVGQQLLKRVRSGYQYIASCMWTWAYGAETCLIDFQKLVNVVRNWPVADCYFGSALYMALYATCVKHAYTFPSMMVE